MQSRLDILKIHSRKMNLMRGIDLKKIAEKMGGASGAELKVISGPIPFFFTLLNPKAISWVFHRYLVSSKQTISHCGNLFNFLFIDYTWFLSGCMHRSRHVCST